VCAFGTKLANTNFPLHPALLSRVLGKIRAKLCACFYTSVSERAGYVCPYLARPSSPGISACCPPIHPSIRPSSSRFFLLEGFAVSRVRSHSTFCFLPSLLLLLLLLLFVVDVFEKQFTKKRKKKPAGKTVVIKKRAPVDTPDPVRDKTDG